MSDQSPKALSAGRWDLLVGIWGVVFSQYAMMHAVSPLLPLIIKDLGLSYGEAGFLYSLPIVIVMTMAFPLGIISARYEVRKLIGFSLALGVLATVLRTQLFNTTAFFLMTIVFGFGLAICYVNLPRFVKTYFPRHSELATGIYMSALTVGIGTSIAVTNLIRELLKLNWRGSLGFWGLVGFIACIAWFWISTRKGGDQNFGEASQLTPEPVTVNKGKKNLIAALVGVQLTILNLLYFSIMGWLPTHLVQHDWKVQVASLATSLIAFLEVPTVIIAPILSARVGLRKPFIVGSYLTIGLALFVVAVSPSHTWVMAPLLGMALGTIFVLLLVIPTEIPAVTQGNIGKVVGVILSIGYVGGVIGPVITGVLSDFSGSFIRGFVFMIVMALIGAMLSFALPETGKKHSRARKT